MNAETRLLSNGFQRLYCEATVFVMRIVCTGKSSKTRFFGVTSPGGRGLRQNSMPAKKLPPKFHRRTSTRPRTEDSRGAKVPGERQGFEPRHITAGCIWLEIRC